MDSCTNTKSLCQCHLVEILMPLVCSWKFWWKFSGKGCIQGLCCLLPTGFILFLFWYSFIEAWMLMLLVHTLVFWNVMGTIILHSGPQINLQFDILLQQDLSYSLRKMHWFFSISALLFYSNSAKLSSVARWGDLTLETNALVILILNFILFFDYHLR